MSLVDKVLKDCSAMLEGTQNYIILPSDESSMEELKGAMTSSQLKFFNSVVYPDPVTAS